MARIVNYYTVRYNDKDIGTYYELSDGNIQYYPGWGCPWDIEEELKALKLDKEISGKKKIKAFSDLIKEEYRNDQDQGDMYHDIHTHLIHDAGQGIGYHTDHWNWNADLRKQMNASVSTDAMRKRKILTILL